MTIDQISYERKLSDGSYGNRGLHVSVALDEGDDPAAVAAQLRTFVADQLAADVKAEEEAREAEYVALARARLDGAFGPLFRMSNGPDTGEEDAV